MAYIDYYKALGGTKVAPKMISKGFPKVSANIILT